MTLPVRAKSLCCTAAFLMVGFGNAQAAPMGVVELFTSQGCSSCPPADAVLERISADPDVITLSFSVDVWDYLGWKDTLARPEYAARQRGYAKTCGDNRVYTPQAIVNGRDDFVGSDETAIRAALKDFTATGHGLSVAVTAEVKGDRLIITVPDGVATEGDHVALWIAGYRAPETVTIPRGENGGRAVTYVNSVERWQVLGMWEGKALSFELPLTDIAEDDTAGVAVILQTKKDGGPGPILGAAKVNLVTQ